MHVCSVAQSHSPLCDLMDCVLCPVSMGLFRQEYWNGLPFSPPGDLPESGIKPVSPALADGFFTTDPNRDLLITNFNSFFHSLSVKKKVELKTDFDLYVSLCE